MMYWIYDYASWALDERFHGVDAPRIRQRAHRHALFQAVAEFE